MIRRYFIASSLPCCSLAYGDMQDNEILPVDEEEEKEVYLCSTQHTIYKELQSNAKLQTV